MEREGRNTVALFDIDVCCGTLITHTLDQMHKHTACIPMHTSVLNINILFQACTDMFTASIHLQYLSCFSSLLRTTQLSEFINLQYVHLCS